MMQNSTINLKHFAAVIGHLSFKAAIFAKQCAENPNLGKYEKGIDDPVTDADYKIQTYITKAMNKFFPALRIVGEESVDYKGDIDLDFDKINFQNYPQECQLDEKVPIDQLCLWIDPIDNTKGFVRGKLEGVTILIGMTRNKKPFLGAITSPYFTQKDKKCVFKPYLNFGYVPSKKAFQTWDCKSWTKLQVPKNNNPFILSTSRRQTHNPVDKIAQFIKAKVDRRGGAGRKVNLVIEGVMDVAIYLEQGNCKWDTCAGDAITHAMGGYFTDTKGVEIDYDPDAKDHVNRSGNICTFNKQLHQGIISSYAKIIKEKL